MEIESYSEEELWRSAGPEETYLDPPPPPISNKQIKAQKKEATKQNLKHKRDTLRNRFRRSKARVDDPSLPEESQDQSDDNDDGSKSSYTSAQLREEYENPKPYSRDRAFARKYGLSTPELVLRRLRALSPAEVAADGDALIGWTASTGPLAARYSRSSLQELGEWVVHLQASSAAKAASSSTSTTDSTAATATAVAAEEEEDVEPALLVANVQALQARAESTLTMLAASMGLSQSALVINQTSGINKLTELAFFFVPLSFVTAVFSMQVRELTPDDLPDPDPAAVAVAAAEHRLHTVGNRAVAKFVLFFAGRDRGGLRHRLPAVRVPGPVAVGPWLGAAATTLYFIVTQWLDPAVLVPCFVSLPVAAAGMWAAWLWAEELGDWTNEVMIKAADGLASRFPEKWRLDSVADDDLSREGVNRIPDKQSPWQLE
ncbi:hypothetical protein ISF_03583 [Cordyceps fumosorosea ARSEF 2679]|uniref:Uncharacterized protein n=1 Tax=Cordyceps fumosorosea (strain ARSEF 2679) TaxID=1081104 RepID=A0A167ZEA3_CORFA|nr:hypothetical protein ISF_03583 [Cordyceps fumosorosea ARSEF 2679]OAA67407.1 hypothetical protein ISF_03583 [Cordyceps fumosorosea ARSEF 2679]